MKKIVLFMLVGLLSMPPATSYAKTFGYLFAKDEIIKIDTETDAITTRTKAPEGVFGFKDLNRAVCAVDMVNKYWITGTLSPRGGFYVYDLQTLKLIKAVSFPEIVKEPLNLKIIYPQLGSKFYFVVEDGSLNNGEGGVISLAYDQKSHSYVGTASNLLTDLTDENFWISEDQSKIYVESGEGNLLRVYDSQSLMLVKTIDLTNIYATGLWNKSVKDIKKGAALLEENRKNQLSDTNNLSFLVYKIADGTISSRFASGIDDKASLLTPDASKIIINETVRSDSGSKAPVKGSTVTGRIHVYNATSGQKLGLVTLPTDFGEKSLGVRPQSDKLYYLKYSRDESKIRLFVVDLVRLRIVKEITVPNLYFMVFFEE